MAINADILRSKFGFNDPNVIEGILRDPGQVARYEREYQGIVNPGASQPQPQPVDVLGEQKRLEQERFAKIEAAKQPVISELESYKAPLKDRYDKIITSIKGREQATIGEQQTAESVEFGKRGIPISSGVVKDSLNKIAQNIREAFAFQEIGAEGDYQDKLHQINLNVANLRSSMSEEAFNQSMSQISALLQKLGMDQSAYQFEKNYGLQQENLGLQKEQFGFQKEVANRPSQQTITSGGRLWLVTYDSNGNVVKKTDLGPSGSGSSNQPAPSAWVKTANVTGKSNQGFSTANPNDYVENEVNKEIRNINGEPYLINSDTGEVIKKVTPEEEASSGGNWWNGVANFFGLN